jgi:NADP-dependent isocitrate dehydrogenase
MTARIQLKNPIVELDGDEMARVMWAMVKTRLLTPYVDLSTVYYDVGLAHRNTTDDEVTLDAGHAIKEHRVGVKCATITPTAERAREYKLKHEWKSPNGTLRGMLDGTVFRVPIMTKNIQPAVRCWKHPIHLARHAYGDVYKNHEIAVTGPGRAHLSFSPSGEGIYGIDTSIPTLACCDVYGNAGGGYGGTVPNQTGMVGNIAEDPLFCGMPLGDLTIDAASPCAPSGSECGMLMGAHGIGCGISAVQERSWGAIKGMYR